jgi:transcription elongation factor Elf1
MSEYSSIDTGTISNTPIISTPNISKSLEANVSPQEVTLPLVNILKIVSEDDVHKLLMLLSSSNKIYVIPLETVERKTVHQYLETQCPKLGKTSLKSKHFHGSRINTFIKCPHCGHRRVPINQYHYGTMENNKDEYRTGTCLNCDERVTFEPNYDSWDDITIVSGNNMIVIGTYFTSYVTPTHAVHDTIHIDRVVTLLTNVNIYEMDPPKTLINKHKLVKYIDELLSKVV